ncbi:MAG TPA: MFS transporter [Ramlibacter sp.]|jgi:hypothetical protein|nr:MFS transporter [Ramlibacter sp.]
MTSTPKFRKIVVAIHGVGDQSHAETIRAVATQFGAKLDPPLPLMPLGYFSVEGTAKVKVSGLDLPEYKPDDKDAAMLDQLAQIGFAEVYWADIPRVVVKAGDTVEETKAWAKTIVSRSEAVYRPRHKDEKLLPHDFDRAAGVIEEMVESVEVLENLCTVADKMGLFKFDLAPLLRDYVNDVQVVTEFPGQREKILGRFHQAMAGIVQQFGDAQGMPEIYIVAHSEGTVVSFLALLQALTGTRVSDPQPHPVDGEAGFVPMDWIRHVRGYMTFGSPIDKHLLLWDRLWDPFRVADGEPSKFTNQPKQPIDWRNYYDFGDPVGFQLDTARAFLRECKCTAFEFPASHDIGFTRYPLPGKAHVDYWKDADVFGHFIDNVVLRPATVTRASAGEAADPKRPADSAWARTVSYGLPYLLVAILHLLAMYLLFKGVNTYMQNDGMDIFEIALPVTLLAFQLLTVTVASRMLRLVKLRWDRLSHVATRIALVLAFGAAAWLLVRYVEGLPTLQIVIASAITVFAATGLVRTRRRMGRRMLVWTGMGFVVLFSVLHVFGDPTHGPAWPLVLAIGAFWYLWWLAILLFDLAFIWHRYIRHSVAQDKLTAWRTQAVYESHKAA